ncbi:hypothetical protein [Pseudomonas linyingensis]|uniref:hypothetical protein n=1 Tax=Pseudomonas linyingensis TaxID=915471 RepID=UPI00111373F2|nr:hypothetical protein [Pseudomonas linyingensis]
MNLQHQRIAELCQALKLDFVELGPKWVSFQSGGGQTLVVAPGISNCLPVPEWSTTLRSLQDACRVTNLQTKKRASFNFSCQPSINAGDQV